MTDGDKICEKRVKRLGEFGLSILRVCIIDFSLKRAARSAVVRTDTKLKRKLARGPTQCGNKFDDNLFRGCREFAKMLRIFDDFDKFDEIRP